jgi:hypothetical protein
MGEKSVLAGGQFILGEVEALTGRLDEAKQKVNRAFNISRAAGDLIYQSLSLGLLGHFKNWTGEYTGAIDLLSKGYQIAKDNQRYKHYFLSTSKNVRRPDLADLSAFLLASVGLATSPLTLMPMRARYDSTSLTMGDASLV